MNISIQNGSLSLTERNEYLKTIQEKHPERILKDVSFLVDGDYVDVSYTYEVVPFQRIRRITGYLVGTLDRFNDGKRAEEHDRVKHSVAEY